MNASSTDVRGSADAAPPLYDRIGGAPALRMAVDRFYAAVLADARLAPYFEGVDVGRVKRHQVLLLASVLGAPPGTYVGRDLGEAHRALGIGAGDFDRVVEHLLTTLRGLGLPADAVGTVHAAVEAARPAVLGEGAPALPTPPPTPTA